jgi:hypothetical protein
MSLFETKVASEFDLCDEVDQEIIEQSKIYGAKTTASVRIDPNNEFLAIDLEDADD